MTAPDQDIPNATDAATADDSSAQSAGDTSLDAVEFDETFEDVGRLLEHLEGELDIDPESDESTPGAGVSDSTATAAAELDAIEEIVAESEPDIMETLNAELGMDEADGEPGAELDTAVEDIGALGDMLTELFDEEPAPAPTRERAEPVAMTSDEVADAAEAAEALFEDISDLLGDDDLARTEPISEPEAASAPGFPPLSEPTEDEDAVEAEAGETAVAATSVSEPEAVAVAPTVDSAGDASVEMTEEFVTPDTVEEEVVDDAEAEAAIAEVEAEPGVDEPASIEALDDVLASDIEDLVDESLDPGVEFAAPADVLTEDDVAGTTTDAELLAEADAMIETPETAPTDEGVADEVVESLALGDDSPVPEMAANPDAAGESPVEDVEAGVESESFESIEISEEDLAAAADSELGAEFGDGVEPGDTFGDTLGEESYVETAAALDGDDLPAEFDPGAFPIDEDGDDVENLDDRVAEPDVPKEPSRLLVLAKSLAKSAAGTIARTAQPLAKSALMALNFPLRFVPPSVRPILDIVVLTMVFWVPIVWAIALFL